MEAIRVNKNSWHYKVIRWVDEHDVPDDICGYTRRLLFGGVVILFLFCFALLILVSSGEAIAWLAWCATHLVLIAPDPLSWIGLLITFLVVAGVPSEMLRRHWESGGERAAFVRTAWRHFHDKTCARLQFTGDDK